MLCYVLSLTAFHFCLKLTHSIQYSGDQTCENLLPGQYFCDSPLIDELTQQPRNCSPSLKAPVNCRPAPGIRCGGRLYSGAEIGFQKLIDCRRVTGYKFDLALLLSVFGGLLGLDRFYLGYPALGCLKFFTFGGFGLWYLADILLISIEKPKDLTWIDNVVAGIAEQDRTLHNHIDEAFGFTLVLDYRWDGVRIQELHCLGIAHDQKLMCIRDLRSCHVPMLKRMLHLGRDSLFSKYSKSISSDNQEFSDNSNILSSKDQILAYIHYPPTFYRLHIHFVHIDSSDNYGTNACRAHILEEVIRNLEQDDLYYANRTITMFLHTNSPMFTAICESSYQESVTNPVSG
ncbi:hypothetical protein MN116_001661 [Schistosoma mekongi]|uniref:TM2 domain-containing protein n=1 Tax=Schistosoma mekongi TaxID=38744 RepID=A0AAE1ZJ72_SCHME|nr:hypothetical protein MN116_001661 [Schistosoma mekongi]